MFSVEIKINGALVGHIYCHNEGYVGEFYDFHSYYYEYYRPQKRLITGNLIHHIKDGIEVLVTKILNEASKKLDAD